MRNVLSVAIVLGLLLAAGCSSSNNGGISGVSPDQARQLHGERNIFESSEDPPITAETHYAAAQFSEAHGDFAKAVKQYDEALKLDPRHAKSVYRLGICYSHLKKHDQAIASWKKYIELTGPEPRGYSNLGFCYELAGQIDNAEMAYRHGIERDAKSVACRTNYGLMLARLGRYAEATLQLQAVLSEAEVHYNLASVYEHQGRKEQAKVEYQKALELDPSFQDAKIRLTGLGQE